MPALTAYFALAGVLPFTIALAGSVRAVQRRLRRVERRGFFGLVLSFVVLAAFAAIDTAFIALVVRSAALTMHPPG
jgi:O-antigen ligase